jgi:hypothetical protein
LLREEASGSKKKKKKKKAAEGTRTHILRNSNPISVQHNTAITLFQVPVLPVLRVVTTSILLSQRPIPPLLLLPMRCSTCLSTPKPKLAEAPP